MALLQEGGVELAAAPRRRHHGPAAAEQACGQQPAGVLLYVLRPHPDPRCPDQQGKPSAHPVSRGDPTRDLATELPTLTDSLNDCSDFTSFPH